MFFIVDVQPKKAIIGFNPLTPRVKSWVIQNFLSFDSIDSTLKCDSLIGKLFQYHLALSRKLKFAIQFVINRVKQYLFCKKCEPRIRHFTFLPMTVRVRTIKN